MLVETVAKGGNLLAEHRPERRRHHPRQPGAAAARVGRVGARARRRDPRVDDVRRSGQRARTGTRARATSCTRSTCRRRRSRASPALTGVDERDDAGGGGRSRSARPTRAWSSTRARSTGTRSVRATASALAADRQPIRLRVASAPTGALGALLAGAAPGDVVDVPAGRYDDEAFPIVVPAGVTLRGEGAARVVDRRGRHGRGGARRRRARRSKA